MQERNEETSWRKEGDVDLLWLSDDFTRSHTRHQHMHLHVQRTIPSCDCSNCQTVLGSHLVFPNLIFQLHDLPRVISIYKTPKQKICKGTYFFIFCDSLPLESKVFVTVGRIPVHCHTHLQSGVVSPVGREHDRMMLVGLEAKVHVPGAHLGVLVPNVAVAPKPHSCSWKENEKKASSLWHFEAMDCIKPCLFS